MTRLARRPRDLLALLAALLTAAAPVLAHAHLALGAQPGYAEVCTERGLARVPVGDGSRHDGGLATAFAHCALCISAGGDNALAGGAPQAAVIQPSALFRIASVDRGASVEPVRAARPRGPPVAPAAIA